jgi:XTP/dITP diphosphohydrolase
VSGPFIAVATSNPGKLKEFGALLGVLGCGVIPAFPEGLARMGLSSAPAPVEDGGGFSENACIKARYWADILGVAALADDSGLAVAALGGAPGVESARWGGPPVPGLTQSESQSRRLIGRMAGVIDRRAEFVTSLAIARPYFRGALIYSGALEGLITESPRGVNGFGYDSVFEIPGSSKTLAELSMEEKNALSHRGAAIRAMRDDWERVMAFLEGGPV